MIERRAALVVLMGAVSIAGPVFGDDCNYRGTTYSNGAAVCQAGSQFRCDGGDWKGLGIACDADARDVAKVCAFDGNSFSTGAVSCQSGTRYQCDDGVWTSLAVACPSAGDAPALVAPVKRSCMYNDATVATESTICKSGITFRCEDGEWRNLGSACQ
jgi:hypothetical protein